MLFSSYVLGEFECTTGSNREGDWIDLIDETRHLRRADADYRRLCEVGIRAVRDGIRWPLVDKGRGFYDFSSVEPLVRAARRYRVDVVWDLFHFGYPAGLDLMSAAFPARVAAYCAACARYLRDRLQGTLWFTPVNEPSYFSWVAGEVGRFAPRDGACESLRAARLFNDVQVFESWDMLCGRSRPELGGSRAHLDVVGINYYWNSQSELGREGEWLDDSDRRRVPLRDLIRSVHERYGGSLVISETSHWGAHRARWLAELAEEVASVQGAGVPVEGICVYPVIGMFDWHRPRRWMPMGLWDCDSARGMRRLVHQPTLDALAGMQERLSQSRWRCKAVHRMGYGVRSPASTAPPRQPRY